MSTAAGTHKELGKITSVRIGACGYQEAMFGIHFELSFQSGNIATEVVGGWDIKRTETCTWTEESRIDGIGNAFNELRLIMKKAKVTEFRKLEGKPIEITFDGMKLQSWRILEEVL